MQRSDIHAVARIVVGAIALLFVSTVLYVTAFHAPQPRGLDVGVVGTPAQSARIQSRLDAADDDGFDVRRYNSEREARAALLDTEVYGVLVVGPRRILLAQALGAAASEAVGDALGNVASASAIPVAARDMRPLPSSDRRGLSSLFTVIGAVIPSLMFGVLLWVFGSRLPWRVRLSAISAYSLLAGLVVALDVDLVVGALGSHFLGIALVCGLLALAVSTAAHGLAHLGGPAGILVAVLILLLLGLSSSGGAVGYQFEPGLYRAVSQLLPPGAAVTAVRNVEYFDWAATAGVFLTLGAWATAGLGLILLGERYGPHLGPAPAARRRSTGTQEVVA